LQTSVGKLNDQDAFSEAKTESANEDVVTASKTGEVQPGTYSVNVSHLARADSHVLGKDTTDDGAVNAGVSDTEDASQINAGTKLSFEHNGETFSFTTDDTTTLREIAEAINDSDIGVNAYISNIGSSENPEYVMSVKSDATGGEDADLITSDGSTPGIEMDTSGSACDSLFAADDGETVYAEQENTVQGQNAAFMVDGVSYQHSENTVEDVIPGVSLDLQGTGDTEVSVEQDTEAIEENVQKFVDSFNEIRSFIDTKSAYSQDSDSAGPLNGSSLASRAEMNLANAVLQKVDQEDSSYEYLNQVGLELQRDGSLNLDSAKFQSALQESPEDVTSLFAGDGGVLQKMDSVLDGYTDSIDGAITYKLDSLDTSLNRLQDDEEDAYESLESYRERLVDKYTNMENQIQQYQQMQNTISGISSNNFGQNA
ncbi:MAG: flagellar filament capping protein FliD, partial [Desulfovermiculus sp.]